jgi:hypothetical protein
MDTQESAGILVEDIISPTNKSKTSDFGTPTIKIGKKGHDSLIYTPITDYMKRITTSLHVEDAPILTFYSPTNLISPLIVEQIISPPLTDNVRREDELYHASSNVS